MRVSRRTQVIAYLLCGLFSCQSNAAPNLQEVINIDGVTIFRDHQENDVFYYHKSARKLAERGNKPDFHYSVNRYLGNIQTGDSDAFWVRGVIKFSTRSGFLETDYEQVRQQLGLRYSVSARLLAAPVIDSYNRLVYATIESSKEQAFNGELEGGRARVDSTGESTGESTRISSDLSSNVPKGRIFAASYQRFTIGVSGNDANLFWDNFAHDNLTLSLAYGWNVSGKIQDESDNWVDSSYQINNSLPINVSAKTYPSLFKKNELWQRINHAYSSVKLMCYDFINEIESDLYYVNVELRFKTKRNQFYTQSIKFTADSDSFETDIDFALAGDIKQGYEYRIRRLSNQGELSKTEWIKSTTPWLDVSASGPYFEVPQHDKAQQLEQKTQYQQKSQYDQSQAELEEASL
jgi:hypothetical protein